MEVDDAEDLQTKPQRVSHDLFHTDLLEMWLPHRRMLHQPTGPRRMSLKPRTALGGAKDATYRPSVLAGVFPRSCDEILSKKWLNTEIERLIQNLTKKIDALPPFKFLLRFSPLHDLEDAWERKAPNDIKPSPDTVPPSGENNSPRNPKPRKPVAELKVPASDPNRTWIGSPEEKTISVPNLAAIQREKLDALQTFLSTNSPSKLQMGILATGSRSVFHYVNAYLAVALNRREVMGSNYNQKVFSLYLRRYLELGVSDKLPVGCLVRELDLSVIPWLNRVSPSNRDLVIGEFLVWVFGEVVNPLVNRAFYVTSTQFLKNERLYFRREIWTMLCRKTVQELVSQKRWRPLSSDSQPGRMSELDDFLIVSRNMQATYHTRFVPRDFGIRPVMVSCVGLGHQVSSFERKQRLRRTSLVLSYLMDRYPALKGLGHENSTAIQRRWIEFRKRRLEANDQRQLYFVTCDIQKAYDSMDISTLREIIQKLYQACKNQEDLNTFFVYDRLKAVGQGEKKRWPPGVSRYKVMSTADSRLIQDNEGLGEPIAVDLEEFFSHISFMSAPGVFRAYDHKWYSFLRGIPQGCSLSSHFLNMYLGRLERELNIKSVRPDELVVRYMDDLVLITPYPDRTVGFLLRASKGVPRVGLTINPEKTDTNSSNLAVKDLSQGDHGHGTPLCFYGWIFDLVHLSLRIDLRRYHPFRIRYAFCMNYADESMLIRSITATISGKFAGALFDLACGTKEAVVQNTYELFSLCGIYLLEYWRKSLPVYRQTGRALRLLRILIKLFTKRILSHWESHAAAAFGELQVRALAWSALATVVCAEGTGSCPLSLGCRQRIIQRVLRSVDNLQNASDKAWMVDFLSVRDMRFPLVFRNMA